MSDAVYRDDATLSSCNSVGGPIPGLPVEGFQPSFFRRRIEQHLNERDPT